MSTSEYKKARILETAGKLFMAYGFKRVSMEEIAKNAGVGKGTVYQLFESKQDLMLCTIDFIGDKLSGAIEGIMADDDFSPIEKLRLFIGIVSGKLSQLRTSALSDLEIDFPEGYEKIRRKRQQLIFGNLTELLRRGKTAGIYDSQLDEALAAHVVIGAISQISQAEVLSTFSRQPEQLFQSILNIVLQGCLLPEYRESLQTDMTEK
ncbi:MAG: TetR/AcrR family transcriptional regulator [Oscillospiraceae bacterium]